MLLWHSKLHLIAFIFLNFDSSGNELSLLNVLMHSYSSIVLYIAVIIIMENVLTYLQSWLKLMQEDVLFSVQKSTFLANLLLWSAYNLLRVTMWHNR